MGRKYFAWSFDDGLEQDKRIIEVLKQYGFGATFHLNSGLFGDRTYEGRIGNLGFTEKPAASFNPAARHLVPYAEHFRIPEDEICQVYEGFEIAAHGRMHVNLARCSDEVRVSEICDDVIALSELIGRPVEGFAYPYGVGAKKCREVLEKLDVCYARSIKSNAGFRFPDDPLDMPMSCWHVSPKAFDRLGSFFAADPADDDLFFLMFAHGYEFDFNTTESNWDKFRRICEAVAEHDDVTCCSIGEAFRLHGGR
ncbi:MAG: polysaccharide deacetylase family protein [Atopobiaceae bacterium]|nr:polysaccharide deacetylase family protein [Atopobiaceae bacterium]